MHFLHFNHHILKDIGIEKWQINYQINQNFIFYIKKIFICNLSTYYDNYFSFLFLPRRRRRKA